MMTLKELQAENDAAEANHRIAQAALSEKATQLDAIHDEAARVALERRGKKEKADEARAIHAAVLALDAADAKAKSDAHAAIAALDAADAKTAKDAAAEAVAIAQVEQDHAGIALVASGAEAIYREKIARAPQFAKAAGVVEVAEPTENGLLVQVLGVDEKGKPQRYHHGYHRGLCVEVKDAVAAGDLIGWA